VTTSATKLGVLPYGDAQGYPFDALFTNTMIVDHSRDLNKGVNALVFWGGTDIWAGLYGQKPNKYNQNRFGMSVRDSIEWHLMSLAVERKIPIIGVCRGAQMLCAMAGGSLIQHVDNHHSSHILETFDQKKGIYANSCHHQMMKLPCTEDVELLAWTNNVSKRAIGQDDEPEVLPSKEPEIVHFKNLRAVGIQGHPEWMDKGTSFVDYCLDLIKEKIL
jgi:gamma-glutamyl-gamma-aminobutyrate hydrolase PuuD